MTLPSLAIVGMGKMGRAVAALAAERGWPVTATITADESPLTRERLRGAEVAIEFTDRIAAPDNIRACIAAACPVVVGTTGWYDALPGITVDVVEGGGALLWAPNFSVGATIAIEAAALVARLIRASGANFDAHIVETHHAAKLDAPSGTAQAFRQEVAAMWGSAVPVTSIRVGAVPGVHEVIFDGAYEQLRIEHAVRDRRVFAEGALVAAAWLVAAPRRGVFTMHDVVRGPVRPRGEGT
jgi:4-hydroxy-tetrahydrodipicolinate reductase